MILVYSHTRALCALSSSAAAAAAIYICTRYGLSTQEIVCDSASYLVLKHSVHSLTKNNYLPTNDLCLSSREYISQLPLKLHFLAHLRKKLLPLTSVISAVYTIDKRKF